MAKRLNDTSALKSQGIKPAGNEYASSRSPWNEGKGMPLTSACGSADYAVERDRRLHEREAMMSPDYIAPGEQAEYRRKTGAGDSRLSSAVKIARGE